MSTDTQHTTTNNKGIEPTTMQRQTFEHLVANGGNMSDAMRKAGYSEAMARNPQKLKSSPAWKQMEDRYFPEEMLAEVHNAGLKATKTITKPVEVEVEDKDGTVSTVIKNVLVEVPDHNIRHRFLDMAYKVRGMYPKESKVDVNLNSFSLADFATKLEKREQIGLPPITAETNV
jgi:hypothetical protein